MRKNSGMRTGIVVLVLLLAVGFAAVTTQLVINGTINIGANTDDFEGNVIFHSATPTGDADPEVTGDSDATATVSADGKTITFTTQILDSIGETSIVEYDIENGSQYNAQLGDMKCNEGNTYDDTTAALAFTSANGYVTVVSDNALSGTTVAKQTGSNPTVTTGKGKVTVTLIRSFAGQADDPETPGVDESTTSTTVTFTCQLTATAVEA